MRVLLKRWSRVAFEKKTGQRNDQCVRSESEHTIDASGISLKKTSIRIINLNIY